MRLAKVTPDGIRYAIARLRAKPIAMATFQSDHPPFELALVIILSVLFTNRAVEVGRSTFRVHILILPLSVHRPIR
jgi:hypothetical protein